MNWWWKTFIIVPSPQYELFFYWWSFMFCSTFLQLFWMRSCTSKDCSGCWIVIISTIILTMRRICQRWLCDTLSVSIHYSYKNVLLVVDCIKTENKHTKSPPAWQWGKISQVTEAYKEAYKKTWSFEYFQISFKQPQVVQASRWDWEEEEEGRGGGGGGEGGEKGDQKVSEKILGKKYQATHTHYCVVTNGAQTCSQLFISEAQIFLSDSNELTLKVELTASITSCQSSKIELHAVLRQKPIIIIHKKTWKKKQNKNHHAFLQQNFVHTQKTHYALLSPKLHTQLVPQ